MLAQQGDREVLKAGGGRAQTDAVMGAQRAGGLEAIGKVDVLAGKPQGGADQIGLAAQDLHGLDVLED